MKLILGYGIVGKSVLEYFKTDCVIYDDSISIEPKFEKNMWPEIDLVIKSAGISKNHAILKEAKKRKIKTTTDIEIFLEKRLPGTYIGITGTNGKSSLCMMLKHILGDAAIIGGNFGESPINFGVHKFYILELSSYQLEHIKKNSLKKIDIGVILNISKHHLARHKTIKNYAKIKKKILNAKNSVFLKKISDKKDQFQNELLNKDIYQFAWENIKKILKILNFDENDAKKKLETYKNLKYRQEVIFQNEKLKIINDSKSCNKTSTLAALKEMNRNFIWICSDIEFDNEYFKINNFLKKVFIHSAKIQFNYNFEYDFASNFEELIKKACQFALNNNYDILFSSAAQSFDFFKNFEHRGALFEEYALKYVK